MMNTVETLRRQALRPAQLNLTWNGQQGTANGQVDYDTTAEDILRIAAEMIRGGEVPGIDADRRVDLDDFVVQRFDAKDGLPNRIVVRPKTPFG